MSDNVTANAGTGGPVFATDEIAGVHYPRSKVVWGPNGTANDTDDSSGMRLPVKVAEIAAGESHIGRVAGYGFDVTVAPAVSAGAYSANDIMGGLMTFTAARVNDEPFMLNELQFAFKSAVTPSLLAVILEADPTGTTKTDNAAYSLAAADVFKVRRALPVNALNGYLTDHGTPNTISLPNINLVMKPATGTRDFYLLLVDLTGVTLGSVSDLQVRACGTGV